MARVEVLASLKNEMVLASLKNEILKKFKSESKIIFRLIYSLGDSPHEGKPLGTVGGVVVKELKYKSFRFYIISDGFKLRCFTEKELEDLLIKFVRKSHKKSQQKTIGEIKRVLQMIGPSGF